MLPKTDIILNPFKHKYGVKDFFEHFSLKIKSPSISFLQEILNCYTAFPYENISKIIKLNEKNKSNELIRLPEEIINDHKNFNLGGTCFSLTFFLQSILTLHGFKCYPVMANMRNRPNVHCVLIVILNNSKYLVDPGYLLTLPVELKFNKPIICSTSYSNIELIFNRKDKHFHLYTSDRIQKKWRYCFQDRSVSSENFLRFWENSFYQGTMHGICLNQIRGNEMFYIHNDYFQITSIKGKQKTRIKENYHSIIREIFSISPELVEQAQAAISGNIKIKKPISFFESNE